MYVSQVTLKKIFLGLIAVAIILGILAGYFYFPTIINKLGMNKTPSKEVQQLLTEYNTPQTPERYIEMNNKVAELANSSPFIDISSCKPYPRIVRVEAGKYLIISNSDTRKHTLSIIGGIAVDVGPSETRKVKLDFLQYSNNVLPYSCDNLDTLTGILLVTTRN